MNNKFKSPITKELQLSLDFEFTKHFEKSNNNVLCFKEAIMNKKNNKSNSSINRILESAKKLTW